VRIFRAVVSAFLVVVFITLLASAYINYRTIVSTAQLVDASSSIANHLALQDLVHTSGGTSQEYTVDPSKAYSLPSSMLLAGDNYSFSLRISTLQENLVVPVAEPPPDRAVATVSLPVAVFDNYHYVPGLMEVSVWRT